MLSLRKCLPGMFLHRRHLMNLLRFPRGDAHSNFSFGFSVSKMVLHGSLFQCWFSTVSFFMLVFFQICPPDFSFSFFLDSSFSIKLSDFSFSIKLSDFSFSFFCQICLSDFSFSFFFIFC